MPGIRLIFMSPVLEPEKPFLVCDLDKGDSIPDPLTLFAIPEYDIHNVNEEGLFAIGGNINADNLEESYKWGIFPWFAYRDSDEVYWYCPRQRFVIFPERIHVSHSLRNLLNKGIYHITINQAFPKVIHNCRMVNGRDDNVGAWLGDDLENIFLELNRRGFAKSVELWEGDKLVGGFYGVWYKGVFQGESMFSLKPSASQIALILFCRSGIIDGQRIKFIDTQFETPTFKRLGGEYISYRKYRLLMDVEVCN